MRNFNSLYEYQRSGIDTLRQLLTANPDRGALLADPPGAGKTPQAIGLAEALKARRVLVICPASLRENWKREFQRWSDFYSPPEVITTSQHVLSDCFSVCIVSYSLAINSNILDQLQKRSFDLLIVDESHYCKSPSSQASRIVLVVLWNLSRYRLLISGTPLPNGRAAEAWTTFSRLSTEAFGKWSKFKDRYCVEQETRWGKTYPFSKNLDELRSLASERFMLRRSKDVVLSQLPGLVRSNIYLTIPELEVLGAQQEIDVEAIVAAIEAGIPLESDHITTARRKLGLLKLPHSVQFCEELLEEVEQLVVFCHHREFFQGLVDSFKKKDLSVVGLHGLMSPVERQESIDAFQSKKARVFVASLKAASTGITLTSAHTLVLAEFDWVPSTNEQAEGRIYRVTQKEIARCFYLCVAGSLDEKILRSVQRKQSDICKAVGG